MRSSSFRQRSSGLLRKRCPAQPEAARHATWLRRPRVVYGLGIGYRAPPVSRQRGHLRRSGPIEPVQRSVDHDQDDAVHGSGETDRRVRFAGASLHGARRGPVRAPQRRARLRASTRPIDG